MPPLLLLVEDNFADAALITHCLAEKQFPGRIILAEDGEVASRFLLGRTPLGEDDLPDLVVLDLNIPKVSGREILAEMKRSAKLSTIPVVILSTSDRAQDIQDCYRGGADAYLIKPCDLESYVAMVERIYNFAVTPGEEPMAAPRGAAVPARLS